jgi:hypothetical protein
VGVRRFEAPVKWAISFIEWSIGAKNGKSEKKKENIVSVVSDIYGNKMCEPERGESHSGGGSDRRRGID